LRRRWDAGVLQDVPDECGRHIDAELAQFTDDPDVAPTRVLTCEPHDQLAHHLIDRRPPQATARIRPVLRDKTLMPTQQRLRAHREHVPGASRQDPAQPREQQPVARREHRPRNLPPQNRELVPQHDDLQVLRDVLPRKQHKQRQQPANDEIHKRQHDLRRMGAVRRYLAPSLRAAPALAPTGVYAPHGF
jgi:hypothetical protein